MTTKELTEAEAYESHSRTVVGSDGETIGKIDEIYLDDQTKRPEWATVSSGLFGGGSYFVPLAGASSDGENIRARVTKEQVKNAPSVQHGRHLTEQEETRLFEHYGITDPNQGATSPQHESGTVAGGPRLHMYVAAENQHDVRGSVRTDRRTSAG
jgi:hypothetical protein